MKKTERMRQAVSGPLEAEKLKEHTEKGWKLVAIEWEREVESVESALPSDVPFGLHVAPDTARLETNPAEREILGGGPGLTSTPEGAPFKLGLSGHFRVCPIRTIEFQTTENA